MLLLYYAQNTVFYKEYNESLINGELFLKIFKEISFLAYVLLFFKLLLLTSHSISLKCVRV